MLFLATLALLIWLYLALAHGRFWQAGPVLPHRMPTMTPPVLVVMPARDEAPLIGTTLHSLLAQDYRGPFRIILVDDNSADGTGDIARRLTDPRLCVLPGAARPAGWSGKLWAIAQGIEAGLAADPAPELILLTDADIEHAPGHVSTLVAQAEAGDLELVSEMVALSCASAAERALVPAFVYFFQLLYPFAWVNDPLRGIAAAAGGTILLRRRALERIGGIAAVRGALIDDVALAAAVKRGGRIWLGHASQARSIRPYAGIPDLWRMVSRTAYVQLRFSPLLLLLTLVAMTLTFVVPPAAALFGHGLTGWVGLAGWVILGVCYIPTLRRFGCNPAWAPLLPLVAAFYTAATLGSAVNHHTGRGVAWKGRAYQGTND